MRNRSSAEPDRSRTVSPLEHAIHEAGEAKEPVNLETPFREISVLLAASRELCYMRSHVPAPTFDPLRRRCGAASRLTAGSFTRPRSIKFVGKNGLNLDHAHAMLDIDGPCSS